MGKKPEQKSFLQRLFLMKLSDTHNFKLKFWSAFGLHVRFEDVSTVGVSAKDSSFFMIPRSLQPQSYIIELLISKVWTYWLKADYRK